MKILENILLHLHRSPFRNPSLRHWQDTKLAICGPGALLALQQNLVVFNRTNQLIENCKAYRRRSKFTNENLLWKLLCLCRYRG